MKNKCGRSPCGHRVIVKPDNLDADEVLGSEGGLKKTKSGILLPIDSEMAKEEKMRKKAVQKGTLVAVGFTAWQAYDDGKPWAKVGETVTFAQYGGKSFKGTDGDTYLVMNDEDILMRDEN